MDQTVRPIDANALYDMIHDNACHDVVGIADVLDFIEITPTLDYAPVKHGKWFYGAEYAGVHEVDCSVCGNYANDYYDFCPNCGAKMEE